MKTSLVFTFGLINFGTASLQSMTSVKQLPTNHKTVTACAAISAASFATYKIAKAYSYNKSQKQLQDIENYYHNLQRQYAGSFSLSEEELAQKYITEKFENTIRMFNTQLETDELRARDSLNKLQKLTISEPKVKTISDNIAELTQKISGLKTKAQNAIYPLDLLALVKKYQHQFTVLLDHAESPQLHKIICDQFDNKKFPYPYIAYHDALESALQSIYAHERNVSHDHAFLKISEELKNKLDFLQKAICSDERYRQQCRELKEDTLKHKQYATAKKQTQAYQQQADTLAQLNNNVQALLEAHANELALHQQILKTFEHIPTKLACSHLSCAQKAQLFSAALTAEKLTIAQTMPMIQRQQHELKHMQDLQYQTFAHLQEQINNLKQAHMPPCSAPIINPNFENKLYPQVEGH